MRWICFCGLIGSLLLWVIANCLKVYHFNRWEVDYKILFVEYTREFGLGPNGVVYAKHIMAFEQLPWMGNDGAALNPVRREWFTETFRSKKPWPLNTKRLTWDEWGPSNWYRPDGLKVTQVGEAYCVPYSMMVLAWALPLMGSGLRSLLRLGRAQSLARHSDKPPSKAV